MRQLFYLIFIGLCISCSKENIAIEESIEEETLHTFQSVSLITGIEKYENYYYIAQDTRDTLKIPATELGNGEVYINDILDIGSSYRFVFSDGEKYDIPVVADLEIKYRVPNISTLRLDGYDIQIKVVLKDRNGLLRINHGEPNLDGLVCSSFIDFTNGRIGYYKPYTADGEKSSEVLIESDQMIPFVKGHEYTIVSSKRDGCVASLSITDNLTGECYEFSPEIGCYESGITNGWGKSSYEVMGDVEVLEFKIYSNQDYNSKLLILGDSNADHGGIGNDKWRNYARQIKKGMGGSAFLVVQGGAGTRNFLTWMDGYVFDLCKPQYCLITTYNETNFQKWNPNILEILRRLEIRKIIPILATIHPAEGDKISDERRKINDWIRNSGYLVFDVAKVISVNNDGLTTWKKVLHEPNWVHYNFTANDLLATNFFETFPYLSNN